MKESSIVRRLCGVIVVVLPMVVAVPRAADAGIIVLSEVRLAFGEMEAVQYVDQDGVPTPLAHVSAEFPSASSPDSALAQAGTASAAGSASHSAAVGGLGGTSTASMSAEASGLDFATGFTTATYEVVFDITEQAYEFSFDATLNAFAPLGDFASFGFASATLASVFDASTAYFFQVFADGSTGATTAGTGPGAVTGVLGPGRYTLSTQLQASALAAPDPFWGGFASDASAGAAADVSLTLAPVAVPEPSVLLLLATGLMGVAARRRWTRGDARA